MGPGRFEIQDIERDSIRIERVDEEKLEIDEGTKMILAPACPACGYDYGRLSRGRMSIMRCISADCSIILIPFHQQIQHIIYGINSERCQCVIHLTD